jgi:radical SAM protein with 4Fe4S-binding SPASM domain
MLREAFSRALHLSVAQPKPGLHTFLREENGGRSHVHLRIEPDGQGTLLVNAARILHLNGMAAQMAYWSLSGVASDQAAERIAREFHVSVADAKSDFEKLASQMHAIIAPDGPCPVCGLALEVDAPFSHRPSAPYRMDLALTYRCQNSCAHCYNARPRSFPEHPTDFWLRALDRIREIGIPHVVFTGGEPTLRKDLPALLSHARALGLITGLNTNGRRLADGAFLHSLVVAGLDHVQITVESENETVHDALTGAGGAWRETIAGVRNAVEENIFLMTNTTLLQANSSRLDGILRLLAELRVPTVGLNALIYSGRGATVGSGIPEDSLPPLLELARRRTAEAGQRLIWYTPTEYCRLDPVQMELGVKGCTAALYNMCVEPDGGVLPCQSYYQPLGNILTDRWDSIWNHDLAVSLRDRRLAPARCASCALLSECGGGCPLAPHTETVESRNHQFAVPLSG